MLLPADFASIVADTFYDKTVSLLGKTTASGDGWVSESGAAITGTFKANVQFNRLGEVQTELGLSERVDVVLTCAKDAGIALDGLFRYDGITYKATAVLPYDSHLTVTGTKWQ